MTTIFRPCSYLNRALDYVRNHRLIVIMFQFLLGWHNIVLYFVDRKGTQVIKTRKPAHIGVIRAAGRALISILLYSDMRLAAVEGTSGSKLKIAAVGEITEEIAGTSRCVHSTKTLRTPSEISVFA